MKLSILSALGALVLLCGAAFAQTPPSPNADVQKAIDDGNARYIAAYAKSDPEAFADVYDDDGTRLGDAGNGSVTRGHAAIAKHAAAFMTHVDGHVTVTATTQRLYVVDNLAYEEGKYTLDFTLKGEATPRHLAGQYVTVWRKQADGGWKIYADMPVPQT
jgi:uncharacterized protein (TIGR02246 family)